MNPTVRVVVPMKPLDESKQRLSGVLPDTRRRQLVLWMLRRVLSAAVMSGAGPVSVVGGDKSVKLLASLLGVHWEKDRHQGLNATLVAAHADAARDGIHGLLFLPADLPLLEAADVISLTAAFDGTNAVLAPGRRGGTNAIIAPTTAGFDFLMGDDSFARHIEALDRSGTPWRSIDSTSLAADIDLPEDFDLLERQVPRLLGQLADISQLFSPLPSDAIAYYERH
ncbi:MAG: 2-phospho-L-lactate guanylyltransferase [Chloroflexota bacterium]